uniref:Putative leucine-rich repeat protein (LRRP) n=1 Tax=Trypanosoma congolense (strain IL3000) TaxID=1068625 RepID=G0UZ78_TRYCI|nr:putative leucine-rich repeat protein (LRRP) [Trypanosoma congolense IL3000]
MPNLSSLNVHMNAISRLECLGNLQNLTELDVSANELRIIDEKAFVCLSRLRHLNLSSNCLTSLCGFRHLPSLEWLSLSFNELNSVEELQRLPSPQKLAYLDVCGNKIPTSVKLLKSLEKCCDLKELRVEVPRVSLLLPTLQPQVELRDNPFCKTEPKYVDRILAHFRNLTKLNGVPCGCDLTEELHGRSHPGAAVEEVTDGGRWIGNGYHLSGLVASGASPDVCSVDQLCNGRRDEGFSLRGGVMLTSGTLDAKRSDVNETSECDGSGSFLNIVETDPSTAERGRGECVSRAVSTDLSFPTNKIVHLLTEDDAAAQQALREENKRLAMGLKRLQEQLVLRVTIEGDLRRAVEDSRQVYAATMETSEREVRRLGLQVDALKDELSRRAQEAEMVERRHRAAFEKLRSRHIELQEQNKREISRTAWEWENKLSQAHKEASNGLAELQGKLDLALQKNEWLQQQDKGVERRIRELQEETQAYKAELLVLERRLKMYKEQQLMAEVEFSSRRELEAMAADTLSACVADYMRRWHRHEQSLLASHCSNQRAWQEYATSLQKHYEEMLSNFHANMTTRVSRAEVGCDPIVDGSNVNDHKEEIHKLQVALSASQESQKLISSENERLLARMVANEKELLNSANIIQELQDAARAAKEKFELERDNLHRTLHNLQDSMKKKDATLKEVEMEAKMKIDEKRAIISKLETRLDDAEEALETQRQKAARLARVEEELQQLKGEFDAVQAQQPTSAITEQLHLAGLLEALNDTKQKLAASTVREHQQSLKLTRAAETLMLVRGQLARVDEVNISLTRELGERDAALREAEAEKQRLQRQWHDAQETARLRQQLTLQTLSQLMAGGVEGALGS